MKVLVLTGPESSGKSWLAEQLQARFGGRVVGEYVRHFIDEQRCDTCYADIPAIARGQLAWEDAARAERPALLILDTHLLSNILWSRILFGACPDWLEPALLRRRYDLHLLLSPEGVAWSADGQRCQPELAQRQAFHRECQAWLERHRQPYRAIAGDWAERESEKSTAQAVVAQRQAELTAAQKRFTRTEALVKRNALPQQQLDDDRATLQSAQAALSAARSQVISAQAAIEAGRSQVIEAQSAIEAAKASVARLQADIDDSLLKAPRNGRVQYRVAQPGEVLPAGGKLLNMVDLADVYMTFFLPSMQAGRVGLGQEVRLVIDAVPDYVIPAKVSYVASVAQFTPKTVETANEREKLMFRVKARLDPALLEKYITYVKTGVPGMAYLRLDPEVEWPANLQIKVPQ